MFALIIQSLLETIFMVVASCLMGIIFGIPLAILLFNSSTSGLYPSKIVYHSLGFIINASRSIPYIILTVLLIPASRILVGSSIGMYAALIPLGLSAILLITKVVEGSLKAVPKDLTEAGIVMGGTATQIVWKILFTEALPNIVSGITLVTVNLVGFSAMAGTVGGGGLGDLAIRYGYQRYDLKILAIVVLILIALVQIIQLIGHILYKYVKK